MVTAHDIVADVLDPELPAVTIDELGVLRDVRVHHGVVEVDVTPTYSGCPALGSIISDIENALHARGFPDVRVQTVLSPPWTTDWVSEAGKAKLLEYGIAPPAPRGDGPVPLELSVRCPHCGSLDTREVSRFGSTACRAIRTCATCAEPFDHMKAF